MEEAENKEDLGVQIENLNVDVADVETRNAEAKVKERGVRNVDVLQSKKDTFCMPILNAIECVKAVEKMDIEIKSQVDGKKYEIQCDKYPPHPTL